MASISLDSKRDGSHRQGSGPGSRPTTPSITSGSSIAIGSAAAPPLGSPRLRQGHVMLPSVRPVSSLDLGFTQSTTTPTTPTGTRGNGMPPNSMARPRNNTLSESIATLTGTMSPMAYRDGRTDYPLFHRGSAVGGHGDDDQQQQQPPPPHVFSQYSRPRSRSGARPSSSHSNTQQPSAVNSSDGSGGRALNRNSYQHVTNGPNSHPPSFTGSDDNSSRSLSTSAFYQNCNYTTLSLQHQQSSSVKGSGSGSGGANSSIVTPPDLSQSTTATPIGAATTVDALQPIRVNVSRGGARVIGPARLRSMAASGLEGAVSSPNWSVGSQGVNVLGDKAYEDTDANSVSDDSDSKSGNAVKDDRQVWSGIRRGSRSNSIFTPTEESMEAAEARVSRKMEDLVISNKSLLAVNAQLETKIKKQQTEIAKLQQQLRRQMQYVPDFEAEDVDDADDTGSGRAKQMTTEDLVRSVAQEDKQFGAIIASIEYLIREAKAAIEYQSKSTAGKVITNHQDFTGGQGQADDKDSDAEGGGGEETNDDAGPPVSALSIPGGGHDDESDCGAEQ
ncbi:hypothetical protein EV182_004018 [Spiromyces aspiralis]|uniref:Uncharacterized protein n=1 Tax=Spiromyces aspiralis TaxID=68401 RepID=A0ACC1HEC3_9FUNG|nr:hypothetical protein EV182_004018 [Spiromyces aspiralis]